AGGARALFAEADRLHLRVGHAECRHRPPHRFGALLAQRQVVFAAAALVGVALDHDAPGLVGEQVARVRVDRAAELVLDHETVEIEVDAALGERARRGVQRSGYTDGRLLDAARA